MCENPVEEGTNLLLPCMIDSSLSLEGIMVFP